MHGPLRLAVSPSGARPHIAPVMFSATALLAEDIPEPRWVVPDLIPEGLSLLVSRPKIGKSWMELQLAVSIALGGVFAGITVDQGAALYLALEDTKRRLKTRLQRQLRETALPDTLTLATQWPRLDAGGIEALEAWLDDHRDARVIGVDTFAKIRPPRTKNADLYTEDYAAAGLFKDLADRRHIGIVLAHHDRKAQSDDWLDTVSGTLGLTAAADAILLLRRARGEREATLSVTGRDIEEQELALQFDSKFGLWSIIGNAELLQWSDTRREIIDLLIAEGRALRPDAVARKLKAKEPTVRKRLVRMAADGDLRSTAEGYVLTNTVFSVLRERGVSNV